jgi:15-cis-phytoene synthase
MNCSQAALAASYASCRRVARRARSSFYPAFFLLGGEQRRAMEALYAFMRLTDDLGDCPRPADQRRRDLLEWRDMLAAALARSDPPAITPARKSVNRNPKRKRGFLAHASGYYADLPCRGNICVPPGDFGVESGPALLPAVVDAVRKFHVPEACLFAVIDGVQMDVAGRRYRTFAELAEYCHCVASAVGLACIHIWGFRGPGALEPARSCGIAFQLTNILRDFQEDAAAGRVYLPQDDLDCCGCSGEDLQGGVVNAALVDLIQLEIRRARQFYREGAALFQWLEPSGRRIFGMMFDVYRAILSLIERRPEAILTRRVSLGRWQKLGIAARWYLLPSRKPVLP